jgi:hypothetical protein
MPVEIKNGKYDIQFRTPKYKVVATCVYQPDDPEKGKPLVIKKMVADNITPIDHEETAKAGGEEQS